MQTVMWSMTGTRKPWLILSRNFWRYVSKIPAIFPTVQCNTLLKSIHLEHFRQSKYTWLRMQRLFLSKIKIVCKNCVCIQKKYGNNYIKEFQVKRLFAYCQRRKNILVLLSRLILTLQLP